MRTRIDLQFRLKGKSATDTEEFKSEDYDSLEEVADAVREWVLMQLEGVEDE